MKKKIRPRIRDMNILLSRKIEKNPRVLDQAKINRRKLIFGVSIALLSFYADPQLALSKPSGNSQPIYAQILPPTQTVNCGAKTRQGYLNHNLQYTGSGTLTITGGNSSYLWAIDTNNCLVVASGSPGSGGSGSFTYGAAPPTLSGTFTLTVSDGTHSSTVTVIILANAAHVSAVNSGPNADTDSSFQLNTYFTLASTAPGALVGGDQVICRDGYFNPTQGDWRIRPPASNPFWPSGRVTIVSENPNYGVDQYGIPWEGGGFTIGYLAFDGFNGDIQFPIDFSYVSFYSNLIEPNGFYTQANDGYDVGFYHCDFVMGADCAIENIDNTAALRMGAQGVADNCRFTNCGVSIVRQTTNTARTCTINRCMFDGQIDDGIDFTGDNFTLTDNFWKNFINFPGNHMDCCQQDRVDDGLAHYNFTATGNIAIPNPAGATFSDGQFLFWTGNVNGSNMNNVKIWNNIAFLTYGNSIALEAANAPSIAFNTCLGNLTKVGAALSLFNITDGTGVTYNRNAVNLIGAGNDPQTLTNNYVTGFSPTETTYTTAMPNWLAILFANTRADVIALATPANLAAASGGFLQTDGTFAGCLFPDSSKNDGNVYVLNRLPKMT